MQIDCSTCVFCLEDIHETEPQEPCKSCVKYSNWTGDDIDENTNL